MADSLRVADGVGDRHGDRVIEAEQGELVESGRFHDRIEIAEHRLEGQIEDCPL